MRKGGLMVARLSIDSDELWSLSIQLNALADELHGFPFRNVGGLPSCASSTVAAAASAANENFELRALLIEAEIRDAGSQAHSVGTIMEAEDRARSRFGGGGPYNPHANGGNGGGGQ